MNSKIKRGLIVCVLAAVVLGIGASAFLVGQEKKEKAAPPAAARPVLRDPFRPDHPTREQWEAEKERKELEAMEKKE